MTTSQISFETLAQKLNGKIWTKGDMKRIYLDRGYNTRKMSTKAFIFEKDGEYMVSVRIECESQSGQWIKSQEKELRESILESIEEAIAELSEIAQEQAAPAAQVETATEIVAEPVKKITLQEYADYITKIDSTGHSRGWIEVKGINTLWLPIRTSNRKCVVNLNHMITGFDENGMLWGANGNCDTPYVIIEVPAEVKDEHLKAIGERVNEKCGNTFPQWWNAMRASNVELVKEVINSMFGNDQTDYQLRRECDNKPFGYAVTDFKNDRLMYRLDEDNMIYFANYSACNKDLSVWKYVFLSDDFKLAENERGN